MHAHQLCSTVADVRHMKTWLRTAPGQHFASTRLPKFHAGKYAVSQWFMGRKHYSLRPCKYIQALHLARLLSVAVNCLHYNMQPEPLTFHCKPRSKHLAQPFGAAMCQPYPSCRQIRHSCYANGCFLPQSQTLNTNSFAAPATFHSCFTLAGTTDSI